MITDPAITTSIREGHVDILSKALQENPALAEGYAKEGVSLLLFAAYCRNQPAVNLLKTYRTSLTIYEAVCTGEIAIAKALLDERPEELNIPSPDGFSLLGYACFFNQPAIARYLIVEKGANVNQPSANAFKVTPLHSACAIASYPLTQLLLDNGADVNARQQGGVTPLHSAAHHGATELVRLLIENGADINAKTDAGETALSFAESSSFSNTAAYLRQEMIRTLNAG
jgi:ankyrin repeat protein